MAKPRRPPSHVSYYVAMVGILGLLLMVICYCLCFCFKKINELTQTDSPTEPAPARSRAPPVTYPVQPVVRDSATAMANLCKQMPTSGKGDTVFPTSTSPAALHADTGGDASPAQVSPQHQVSPPVVPQVQPPVTTDKAPPAACVTVLDETAVR